MKIEKKLSSTRCPICGDSCAAMHAEPASAVYWCVNGHVSVCNPFSKMGARVRLLYTGEAASPDSVDILPFWVTFMTPYEQHKDRQMETCKVLGDAKFFGVTYDESEVGKMYMVEFADGVRSEAWPEEIGFDDRALAGISMFRDEEDLPAWSL